jgi:hypothetical protein
VATESGTPSLVSISTQPGTLVIVLKVSAIV